MKKIVQLNQMRQREKDKQEFRRLGDLIDEESADYERYLERVDRKIEMGGNPSERDIDTIIEQMGTLCQLARERRNLLRKINPKAVEEIEEIEDAAIREAIQEARQEFYETEYGMKVVK